LQQNHTEQFCDLLPNIFTEAWRQSSNRHSVRRLAVESVEVDRPMQNRPRSASSALFSPPILPMSNQRNLGFHSHDLKIAIFSDGILRSSICARSVRNCSVLDSRKKCTPFHWSVPLDPADCQVLA
jgi:hypothetical protein